MIWVLTAFFVLLVIGVPIGYVLGISGVLGILQIGGTAMLSMAPQRYFAGLDLFTFLAMPLFIFAGEIMNKAGITERLAKFAEALVGHLRGGMAQSCMVSSVLFAGITGALIVGAFAERIKFRAVLLFSASCARALQVSRTGARTAAPAAG